MRRLAVLAVLIFVLAGRAAADSVLPINDLIERATELDRQMVTVAGEVVGDIMPRGDHGWITITDGTNDLGIWAPVSMLQAVRHVGRYQTEGDWIRVSGEFRRSDPSLGGDLVLRATGMEVIRPGRAVTHVIPPGRVPLAVGSLLAAGLLGLWLRIRSR